MFIQMKLNTVVTIVSGLLWFAVSSAYAQPYYYYPLYADDRWNATIYRLNLQTGTTEQFPVNTRVLDVKWEPSQTWLYVYPPHGESVEIVNCSQPTNRHILPDEVVDLVAGVLFIPQKNQFYVSWTMKPELTVMKTGVFDASTFRRVDTISIFGIENNDNFFLAWEPYVLSLDGSLIYTVNRDTIREPYLVSFSTSSHSIVARKRLFDIGPPTRYKLLEDGKKGKALISYEISLGFENLHYFTYDPIDGSSSPPIPFPWRSKGHLSADAKYVIIEEVQANSDPNPKSPGEIRPGNICVFEAATGKLMRRLGLPPEGKILVFDNYPEMFYYYRPDVQQAISINVTTVMPASVLLDTLAALKHHAAGKGWLADDNFVKELDNGLNNARKHLVKGDSVNCAKELQTFQKKVQKEYDKAQDDEKNNKPRDKRFVTSEGYALLYLNTQYLLDRLPEKK